MAEAEKYPMIYRSIAGVIADVDAVGKDKENKQQGFKFRSIDDVYNALHPALAKNKVVIVPNILSREVNELQTARGTVMHHVICTIKFTFFAEDGSSIESTLVGEALDTGDKATNKAMAIAYKYACFQVFCIPTSDMADPDAESVSGMQPAGNPPQSQQTGTPPAADMRTSKINGEMIRRLQGELVYKGQKWDNMSGSERLMVSTAIVRKLNPECGFVLLDKLEQMDLQTLQEFGSWLEHEGLQAIATRVSTGDECSIIIEDGYVVGQAQAEQPQQKSWKAGVF